MPWNRSRPEGKGTGAIYNTATHRKAREAMMRELRDAGWARCCLGGEVIYPDMGARLHADHCPNCVGGGCDLCGGFGYRGLACAAHNSQDGARRARARQLAAASREW
jgi:hypothetical protein